MGKITISLPDDLEKQLREYVTRNYPVKPFGKLSKVVEEALKEWLKRFSNS